MILPVVVELHDAAGIDVGKQPFVLRQPAGHALAHAGMAQRQVEARRAHAEPGHPVIAVRGAVDVVGIARHVLDDAFDACRPSVPRTSSGGRGRPRLSAKNSDLPSWAMQTPLA